MTASHVNVAPTTIKLSTPVILSFFLAAGCDGGHALEDLFLSLSYQGVEMLAELWLGNLYVYQVIITPEIGNCPPPVCCVTSLLLCWLVLSVMLLAFR